MKKLLLVLALMVPIAAEAGVQVRRSFIEKPYSLDATSVTTSAYSSGMVFGGSYTTLSGVAQDASGYATLWGLSVSDTAGKLPPIDLLFYNTPPTLAADHVAFGIDEATQRNGFVGMQSIAATDINAVGDKSVVSLKNLVLPLKTSSASKLYVVAVARKVVGNASGSGYTSATSIKVKLLFGQE